MAWWVVGASARGASHLRSGQPNQDAIAKSADKGSDIAVAVSDGHGSAKCFRSDAGSRIAVDVATQSLRELADKQTAGGDPAELNVAAKALAATVVQRWRAAVQDALRRDALAAEELSQLESAQGFAARRSVEEEPLLAYGATLLGVLVTEGFVVYFQLGDGDILVVDEAGAVTRAIPRDARLFGNQTTSLCGPEAWNDVQIEVRAVAGRPPALILLSTDGYANSFADDSDFLQVGADMLAVIRSEGLDAVRSNLEDWLAETSRLGSGDDITVAMLCSQAAMAGPAAPFPNEQTAA